MIRTRVFEVLEERGQKQRWLIAKFKSRGYRVSESYLSQIKAGVKEPSPHFIHAVCEVLEMPESRLFYVEERKQTMKGKNVKKVAVSRPTRKDAKPGKGKINVAIVGVGNCASSLVQGRYFYENASEGQFIPGLMHVNLGGYHIRDINFVAAIDIDQNKVGKDLSQAIFTKPNNTIKICDVPRQGVRVARGMTHDGLGKYLSQIIKKSKGGTEDIVVPHIEHVLKGGQYGLGASTILLFISESHGVDSVQQLLTVQGVTAMSKTGTTISTLS